MELIKTLVFLWLAWSVLNQMIPEAISIASATRRNGLYWGFKAVITTVISCIKCFFFWSILIYTGDLFLAAFSALIAQLLGRYF